MSLALDPLTHSLIGLHIARLPAAVGAPIGARILVCLAASNAPDLDRFLLLPLRKQLLPLGPAGTFHSLLGAALLSTLIGFIARPLVRPEHRRILLHLAWASVGLHLAADLLATTGLPLFWPLGSARYGLSWLSSPDHWLWVLLAAPLARTLLAGKRGRLQLASTRTGVITLVSLYVGICAVSKARAIQATWSILGGETHTEEVQAYPAGPGPFTWITLSRGADGVWHRRRVALLGGIELDGRMPSGASDPRMRIAGETPEGRAFLANAKAPFLAHATEVGEDGFFEVAIGDLRFADRNSERLPWVLWLRIGPDFSTESWKVVSTPH